MGNGASLHGPSHHAHPRLYQGQKNSQALLRRLVSTNMPDHPAELSLYITAKGR
jgi:hypothetical protein